MIGRITLISLMVVAGYLIARYIGLLILEPVGWVWRGAARNWWVSMDAYIMAILLASTVLPVGSLARTWNVRTAQKTAMIFAGIYAAVMLISFIGKPNLLNQLRNLAIFSLDAFFCSLVSGWAVARAVDEEWIKGDRDARSIPPRAGSQSGEIEF